MLASSRAYDGAGRVTELTSYVTAGSSTGAIDTRRVNSYNDNGWMISQDSYNNANTLTQRTSYTGIDNLGNVTSYNVAVYTGTNYTNYYNYTYVKDDTYKTANIAGSSTYFQAGNTASTYDLNGHLTRVVDSAAGRTRDFVNDADGTILRKTDNGTITDQYYANDKAVGTVTANPSSPAGATADFDYNYTPISDAYPSVTPGNYVVGPGDTLRSIAYRVYGDPKLWYLIADANGLSLDADLRAGQSLKIPNRVSNLHNDVETNRPYNAGAIIGDLTPNLPDPPPVYSGGGGGDDGGGCGGFGQIAMLVVAVVVAVYVGPAALQFVLGEGVAIGAATAGQLFVAGAITGAASNLAGQVVGNITGLQDGINFAGIAGAALGGGLTAGLTGSLPGVEAVNTSAPLGGVDFSPIARAALTNVVSQGANILVGAQDEFSWVSVAGAAVGAAVGNAISENFLNKSRASGLTGLDPKNLLAQAAGNFAGGATRQLLSGGRINFASLAADAFGNTLGTALAYGGVSNASQAENNLQQQEDKRDAAMWNAIGGGSAPAAQSEWSGSGLNPNAGGFGLKATPSALEAFNKQVGIDSALSRSVNMRASEYVADLLRTRGGTQAILLPGMGEIRPSRVSDVGGHFTDKQLVGQAFIGVVNPRTGLPFTQIDLNLLVAHSQFFDQLKDFDATAAGIRYISRFTFDRQSLLVQESGHSLNEKGAEWNLDRARQTLAVDPDNLALGGGVMHFTEDRIPHAPYGSGAGHAADNILGKSPDNMTVGLSRSTFAGTIEMFERITGVSADTVLPGHELSIRQRAQADVNAALKEAGRDGATGEQFEQNYNAAARELLSPDALRLPTTMGPSPGMLFRSTQAEAVATTDAYLKKIGLNVEPRAFLDDAVKAYSIIANKYLDMTGGVLSNGRQVDRVDPRYFFHDQYAPEVKKLFFERDSSSYAS